MEFVQLSICMYIVLYCENVMSPRLFEIVCLLPYFEKCKLYIQVLGYVLYAAVMLSKFYKITSLEKKKILYKFSASNTASLHRIL